MNPNPEEIPTVRGSSFETTHWSVVLAAGGSESDRGREALEKLCQSYWYPLYAFVRRQGYSAHDAQDLTQGFFATLIEKSSLGNVVPEKGRFRSFLLASFKHFLSDEWDKARAQKRGGHYKFVPLEFETAETRFISEPQEDVTPEKLYQRRWAETLLEQALSRLENEYKTAGKGSTFQLLSPLLTGEREDLSYAALGRKLKRSEGSIKVAVHRLRGRYREILFECVGSTLENPGEVEQELQNLLEALRP